MKKVLKRLGIMCLIIAMAISCITVSAAAPETVKVSYTDAIIKDFATGEAIAKEDYETCKVSVLEGLGIWLYGNGTTADTPYAIELKATVPADGFYTMTLDMMANVGDKSWYSILEKVLIDDVEQARPYNWQTDIKVETVYEAVEDPFISTYNIIAPVWLTEGEHTFTFAPRGGVTLGTDTNARVNFRFKNLTLTPGGVALGTDTLKVTTSDAYVVKADGSYYGIADAGSATGGTALASKGIAEFYTYRVKLDTKAASTDTTEQASIANNIDRVAFFVEADKAGYYNITTDMSIYKTTGGEITWLSKAKIGVNGKYTSELTDQNFNVTTEFNMNSYCTIGTLKDAIYLNKGVNEISFKPSARASDGYNKWFRVNNFTLERVVESQKITTASAIVKMTDGTSYDIADAGSATGGTALASKGIAEFYTYRVKLDTKAASTDITEQTAVANAIDEISFNVNVKTAGWYNIQPDMSIYKTTGGEITWLSKAKIGVNGKYTSELTDQNFNVTTEFNTNSYCTIGTLKDAIYLNKGDNTISFKPSVRASDGYNKWFRVNNFTITEVVETGENITASDATVSEDGIATVTLSSTDGFASHSAVAIFAVKETETGILKSVSIEKIPPVVAGATTEFVSSALEYDATTDSVSIFFWESLNSLAPLCKAVNCARQGI